MRRSRRVQERQEEQEEEGHHEEQDVALSDSDGTEGVEDSVRRASSLQTLLQSLLGRLRGSSQVDSAAMEMEEEEVEEEEAEEDGEWVDEEEEMEEEEEEDEMAGSPEASHGSGGASQRSATSGLFSPVDTIHPNLAGTELAEMLQAQTGKRNRMSHRYGSNAATMIRMGTLNANRSGRFTSAEQTCVLQRYLPGAISKTAVRVPAHIFCGTYSKNGDMFMSACQDGNIRLYDTSRRDFELVRVISARDVGWSIIDTCYSPDQRFLIYSSWSDSIKLVTLDGERHEELQLRAGGHLCPFSIRFSEDSREVLAGANDGCIYLYDCIHDCLREQIPDAHDNDINAVCFTDDSSNIFCTGSDDYLCKVWDRRLLSAQNPRPVGTLVGHTSGITFIDSRNDGRYILSQGKDQCIKLWDIRRMSANPTLPRRDYNTDYRFAIFSAAQRQRKLKNDASLMTFAGHHSVFRTLIRARFSPVHTTAQRFIYSGSGDGSTTIYDILTGDCVARMRNQSAISRDVSWHPYLPIIASSSWDGTIVTYRNE